MTKERLYLFDTTLRDGAQTQGVDFSVEDKRQIALALDGLGLDYIEGGWPGANPTDTEFFAERPPLKTARFTAFGMTKRSGRSAANDPGLAMGLDSSAESICLVGKTSDYQVRTALEIPLEENVDNIAKSIAAVKAKKREPLFDAEHFFDGYKANPDYALACIRAAHGACGSWLVLCDTNGGTMPDEVYRVVSEVKAKLPKAALGIHAHNDTEQAVAVSLAAIRAGVRQVQGTLNGLGERCGNANLCSLLPNLMLKEPFASQFETGVSRENLKQLTHVSRLLDEILNRPPARYAAYVGASAFPHKGGAHASPEHQRHDKNLPGYFTVDQSSVTVERVREDGDQMRSRSKAAVELMVAGQKIRNAGTGNGPVNALDAALRKDLGKYSPFLADLRLVDYKVRILTSGTEAVTRVTVESADGKGNRWSTVGLSENIVDASFEALTDSIIYKLYRDKAPA